MLKFRIRLEEVKMKKINAIGLAALILLFGCAKKENVIKIGMAVPLTGDQAAIGQDEKNAVELAFEEINAEGGVLGKKIRLVAMDDKADPKEAVNIARRFAGDRDILAIIGHLNSGCTIAASKVYNEADLAMITPSATNPEITRQGFKNVFRACTTDAAQGRVAGRFAAINLKRKKIAVLHDKTQYGQGLAEEFVKAAKENKAEIAMFEGITKGEMDYTAIASKIKALKPDMVYFGGMYPEGSLLVKQMRDLNIKAVLLGGDGLYAPERLGAQREKVRNLILVVPRSRSSR